MALASLLCAALSLVCIVLALPTTPIAGVGAFFAFSAPVLAFTGIVAGGVAISRARKQRAAAGLAMIGVLTSLASLVPALFTAVTLGLLNLLFTHGPVQVQRSFHMQMQSGAGFADGGGLPAPPSAPPLAPQPEPEAPARGAPPVPGAPPPAFPPPPLAPKRP